MLLAIRALAIRNRRHEAAQALVGRQVVAGGGGGWWWWWWLEALLRWLMVCCLLEVDGMVLKSQWVVYRLLEETAKPHSELEVPIADKEGTSPLHAR
jgi:hypothetical protein